MESETADERRTTVSIIAENRTSFSRRNPENAKWHTILTSEPKEVIYLSKHIPVMHALCKNSWKNAPKWMGTYVHSLSLGTTGPELTLFIQTKYATPCFLSPFHDFSALSPWMTLVYIFFSAVSSTDCHSFAGHFTWKCSGWLGRSLKHMRIGNSWEGVKIATLHIVELFITTVNILIATNWGRKQRFFP